MILPKGEGKRGTRAIGPHASPKPPPSPPRSLTTASSKAHVVTSNCGTCIALDASDARSLKGSPSAGCSRFIITQHTSIKYLPLLPRESFTSGMNCEESPVRGRGPGGGGGSASLLDCPPATQHAPPSLPYISDCCCLSSVSEEISSPHGSSMTPELEVHYTCLMSIVIIVCL